MKISNSSGFLFLQVNFFLLRLKLGLDVGFLTLQVNLLLLGEITLELLKLYVWPIGPNRRVK